MRRTTPVIIVLIVSCLAVIGGLALAMAVPASAAFGWFAYAPLSGQVFLPGLGMQPWLLPGLLLTGAGLLGIGFGVGWLVAARGTDADAG